MSSGVSVSLEELLRVGLESKGIRFLPSRKMNSILSGRHTSKLRGRGMDFLELKSYVQGDDVKHIDWRATQRSQKTYVRVFNEERDRAVYIVVSQQSNMFFGTRGSFKSVQAAKIASIALHSVLKNGDRVGAVVFDDTEIVSFKASKSKQTSMYFLKELARLNQALLDRKKEPNNKMLNKALDFLMTQVKHDDLILIIGDGSGLDGDSNKKLTHLAAHNDIIGIMISDPMEKELPDLGSILFRSFDKFLEVNSSSGNFKKSYKKAYDTRVENYKELSLVHKIPLLEISTDEDVLFQLHKQLGTL